MWGDKEYVLPDFLNEFAGKVDFIYNGVGHPFIADDSRPRASSLERGGLFRGIPGRLGPVGLGLLDR